MIYVGTSGFSFKGWVGSFYPAGTRPQQMLEYYARHFPAVEINSTYYRLPPASTFQSMVDRTPPEFRFVVKLSGVLTHGRTNPERAPGAKSSRPPRIEKPVNLDLFAGSPEPASEPGQEASAHANQASEEPAREKLRSEITAPEEQELEKPRSDTKAPDGSRQEEEALDWNAFLEAIAPMESAGRLDGILAQFPYRFRDSKANRDWLRRIRNHLGARPAFVEFRHDSWAKPSVTELLRELDLGFTVVDAPNLRGLFPPVVRLTGDTAYFRFHGRNAERWWDGDNSTRYDYLYSGAELEEWARKIHGTAARARQTFVFFNNCHAGQAAANAEEMTTLLRDLSGAGS